MDSNIVAYLKTRKFWDKLITLALVILTWVLPQLGLDIPVEVLVMITVFLLAFASWVITGDINFDLATVEQARQLVDDTQKNTTNITMPE